MPTFANQAAFDRPASRLLALTGDLSPAKALVDVHGTVLVHPRTGGLVDPERHVLKTGTMIYRFGDSSVPKIASGAWWIEQPEFERLVNFAIGNNVHVALAMRLLCLVPPPWNKFTVLLRARVADTLLAWRGLGNTAIATARDGLGTVTMPHQNVHSARRVHQLCIPGLAECGGLMPPISVEDVRHFDKESSLRGFLYL